MKKKLWFFLKLGLGLGLLTYFIITSDPQKIIDSLVTTDLLLAMAAFSLHLTGLWIKSMRWNVLLKENDASYSVIELIKFNLVSNFFNLFLPTRFGGDIVRITDTRTINKGISASAAIVFIERVSGIFILIIFALAASLIRMDFVKELPIVWIVSVLGFLGMVFMYGLFKIVPENYFSEFNIRFEFGKKLLNKLDTFNQIVKSNLFSKVLVLKVFAWGLLLQLNVIVHYYLIGLSLGMTIPFIDYFLIISIYLIALSIPLTPNGVGIRELVLIHFFTSYGFKNGNAIAVAFSALDMLFALMLGVFGWMIYVTRKK